MTTLFEAVNSMSKTTNGCAAFASSLDANLDFFFAAGASRGKDITKEFTAAYAANPEVAVRTALWMRDVREGAGERQLFRDTLLLLDALEAPELPAVIKRVKDLGRWDDLLVLSDSKSFPLVAAEVKPALAEGNGLCAKWLPRKGAVANKLRKLLGIKNPKHWRKTLVAMSNTVEQKMCAKQWNDIEFSHVPSVAAARYQKAFFRNAGEKYEEYREALVKGEAKINAGAVYPYDVIRSLRYGDAKVASAQWDALPNYMEGCEDRILPIVDVSGSMGCPAGKSSSVSCLDVAVSLGLYISERNVGPFKDMFVTFSERPTLEKVSGNLKQRFMQMATAHWGMSTDLEAVFDLLLNAAVKHNVAEEQMPNKILILSDMQFNYVTGGTNETLYEAAKRKYEAAGYKLPQVVFWNINSYSGTVPVTATTAGTSLVSGFSPSILKSLLNGSLNPVKVMLDTVMKDRYKI